MPYKSVACSYRSVTCCAIVDGQVQGHYRVATCSVGSSVCCSVVRSSVLCAVPCVSIASGLDVNTCCAIVDGQFKVTTESQPAALVVVYVAVIFDAVYSVPCHV